MKAAEYQSISDPTMKRSAADTIKKPPGFYIEAIFCSVSLFLLKLYSD